jgi:serine/threonine protein kinase
VEAPGSPPSGSLGAETEADDDIGLPIAGHQADGARAEPGTIVGRYVVVDLLGSGGMGTVYRAYDPELDRIVALKLVHTERESAHGRARLQREAQAIARLSHPHVVQVFDAGTDSETDTVFIAMEYVPGTTLGCWTKGEPRSLEALFEVFRQAGEGLRAAHKKEIVHRDFKPDNVLITDEGVAKVLDFGLAKPITQRPDYADADDDIDGDPQLDEASGGLSVDSLEDMSVTNPGNLVTRAEDELGVLSESAGGRRNLLSDSLTRDGAAVGTPAYMPPEQMRGEASDARADQYSFAVALYEALFGHLPFSGQGAQGYMLRALEGAVRPIPRDTRVPRSMQRAILRALSPEPADRFETLDPLLLELARHPRHEQHRRWAWFAGGAILFATVLGGFTIGGGHESEEDLRVLACTALAERTHRDWTRERRDGIHAAISAVPRDHASATADLVDESLTALVDEWRRAELHRCLEADELAGERRPRSSDDEPKPMLSTPQPTPGVSLARAKLECLDRSAVRFQHLLDALSDPTAVAVDRSIEAIDELRQSTASCEDASHLRALLEAERPGNPEEEALRDELAEIKDHLRLGALDKAAPMIEALPRPPEDGRWPADLALTWAVVIATRGVEIGDYAQAKRALEYGGVVALGSLAPLATLGWLDLHARTCTELGDLECSRTLHRRAHAHAQSIYGPQHALTLEFRSRLGDPAYAAGDYPAALELYESAAVAARERLPKSHATVLWADHSLAAAQLKLGRHEQAVPLLQSVHERARARFGESHPHTISIRFSLAQAHLATGNSEQALSEYRALAREGSPSVDDRDAAHSRAVALTNLGGALIQLDRPAEAIPPILEAREAMLELTRGEETADTMAIQAQLAAAHQVNGEHQASLPLYEACLAHHERGGTLATRNGIMVAHGLARAYRESGRPAHALEVIDAALARIPEGGDADLRAKLEARRKEIRENAL